MAAGAFKFPAWVVVISILCWAWAFADWWIFAQVPLTIAPLILWKRSQFQERVSRHESPFVVWVIIALVVVLVLSAVAGWSLSSNRWFENSEFRPVFALLVWAAYIYGGYVAFFNRRAA